MSTPGGAAPAPRPAHPGPAPVTAEELSAAVAAARDGDGWTTRGVCFAAAGVAVVVSAFVLRVEDLVAVGVLLLAVPLASTLALRARRPRWGVVRTLDRDLLQVGESAVVTLRLDGAGRRGRRRVVGADTVPPQLAVGAAGGRPGPGAGASTARGAARVCTRTGRDGATTQTYRVRPTVRGVHLIGPFTTTDGDAFGTVRRTRAHGGTTEVVVLPRVHPLDPSDAALGPAPSGDPATLRSAVLDTDDVATREYRTGDELRRVHWRSTARTGTLMVRREEPAVLRRAVVLLDPRERAHGGGATAPGTAPDDPARGSSWEWCVEAAASVVHHLHGAAYRVQLLVGDDAGDHGAAPGRDAPGTTDPGDDGTVAAALLRLAVADTVQDGPGERRGPGARRAAAPAVVTGSGLRDALETVDDLRGELVVCVLADLDADDVVALCGALPGAGRRVALVCAVDSFDPDRPDADDLARRRHDAVATLGANGWVVGVGSHGHDVARAWAGLGSHR